MDSMKLLIVDDEKLFAEFLSDYFSSLDDFEIVGVVDYEIWYYKKVETDIIVPFCATVHLIRNEKNEIVLSSESLRYKWITEEEVDNYKYFWNVTPRFIKNGFKMDKFLSQNK